MARTALDEVRRFPATSYSRSPTEAVGANTERDVRKAVVVCCRHPSSSMGSASGSSVPANAVIGTPKGHVGRVSITFANAEIGTQHRQEQPQQLGIFQKLGRRVTERA